VIAAGSNDYIAYQRDGDLYYVYSNDLHGTSWYTPVRVDAGSGSNTGQFPRILDVNGTLAIAYVDGDAHTLMYVRYSSGWLSPQTIASNVSSTPISMELIDGRPAIAYLDSNLSDVRYIRASNSTGSSWPGSTVLVEGSPDGPTGVSMVETQPGSGYPLIFFKGTQNFGSTFYEVQCRLGDQDGTTFGSMAIVALSATDSFGDEFTSCLQENGYPAVAFQGDLTSTWGDLRLCRATNSSGSSWNSQQVIDNGINSGHEPGMLLVNSKLGITYNEQNSGYICVSSATETVGASDGFAAQVETAARTGGGQPGADATMILIENKPAFGFNYQGTLAYKRANDTAGEDWPANHIRIDNSGTVGLLSEMVLTSGVVPGSFPIRIEQHPSLAYIDSYDNDLYYVRCDDTSGGTWPTPTGIESGTYVGDLSMTLVGGYPAITYFDHINNDLWYVRATTINGSSWGTPAKADDALDGDLEYYYGVSIAGSVNGNPGICYTKTLTYPGVFPKPPPVTYFYFVRATNSTGSAWGTPYQLRAGAGICPSLLGAVDGEPAVSSGNSNTSELVYQRGSDASGSAWDSPIVLDDDDINGGTNLAVVNGNPAIAYTANNGVEELRYIRSTDDDGDSSGDWPVNAATLIDRYGDHVGAYPNLVDGGLGKMFGYGYIDPNSEECLRFCNTSI